MGTVDVGGSSFGTGSGPAARTFGRAGGGVVSYDGMIWDQTYGDFGTYEEAQITTAAKGADALEVVARALGIGPDTAVGTELKVHGPDEFDAVLDYRDPYFIGLRTDRGLTRIFGRNHWGHTVGISLHDFTPGTKIEECEAEWQGWLNKVFNQP